MAKTIGNVIRRDLENIYFGKENLGRVGKYGFEYGYVEGKLHRRLSFWFVMLQSSIEEFRLIDEVGAASSALRFEWQPAQKDFVVPELRTQKLRACFHQTANDEVSTIEVGYSDRVKSVAQNDTEIIFRVPMGDEVE
jgi:hypothetical protein